uniref:Uncharacterized protein n=1 Tax=Micrurus spixii TaxID=129469 RepID=A0A2D4LRH7_9SAUR
MSIKVRFVFPTHFNNSIHSLRDTEDGSSLSNSGMGTNSMLLVIWKRVRPSPTVHCIVVGYFHKRQQVGPVRLLVVNMAPKVLLDHGVHLFRCAIHARMKS